MDETPWRGLSDAERLLATHQARHPLHDEAAFEALCAREPLHAEALRRLRPQWLAASALLPSRSIVPPASPTSLSAAQAAALQAQLLALSERGDLDRYVLREFIGHGGAGVVHKVHDKELGRDLAMKIQLREGEKDIRSFPPSVADDGGPERWVTAATARFLQEAFVTARLDHPGIVPVHRVGADGSGRPFFTMKFVQGDTLASVLNDVREQRNGWSTHRVVSVLQRVCEAVSYAHSKNTLHGDLKPGNIMVGGFGETYVMDWGMCARIDHDAATDSALTAADLIVQPRSGSVQGTIPYMAPEQARGGTEELTVRADVYSIGAILYHLLTGRMPFQDAALSLPTPLLLARVGSHDPFSAGDPVHPDHGALLKIAQRAMARDPADRHPTVARLGADLADYLADLSDDRRRARLVSGFLQQMFAESGPDRARGEKVTVTEVVERAAASLDHDAALMPGDRAVLRLSIGRVQYLLDQSHEARAQLERAQHEFIEAGLVDSREEMICRCEQAEVEFRLGNTRAALEILEPLLARQTRVLGPDDTDTLDTAFQLAEVLRKSGIDHDRAFRMLEDIHARRARVLGEGHLGALGALGKMGHMLGNRGDHDRALEIMRRVLHTTVLAVGSDHPEAINARGELAASLIGAGKVEDALPLLLETVALSERVNGPDHTHTVTFIGNAAIALLTLDRVEEAEDLSRKLLDGARRRNAYFGRHLLAIRNNFALVLGKAGRLEESLAEHFATVEQGVRNLGKEHPFVGRFRTCLAKRLVEVGRTAEAEQQLALAHAVFERDPRATIPWARECREALDDVRRRIARSESDGA